MRGNVSALLENKKNMLKFKKIYMREAVSTWEYESSRYSSKIRFLFDCPDTKVRDVKRTSR